MTTTAWAHLPNATHIARVIADVGQRPEAWVSAWSEAKAVTNPDAWCAAVDAAWNKASDADMDVVWGAAVDAVMAATRDQTAIDAAWDAIYALVAWNESAALIDLPACTRVLAVSGDPIAILMLPATLALKGV
jgi:hypothetical protein